MGTVYRFIGSNMGRVDLTEVSKVGLDNELFEPSQFGLERALRFFGLTPQPALGLTGLSVYRL